MKELLKYPQFNALGIGVFSVFYGFIFIFTAAHYEYESVLYYTKPQVEVMPFWSAWSQFLEKGGHGLIGIVIATAVLIVILLLRRHTYDEYHTSTLIQCLAVSIILMMAAVAAFYLAVLSNPNGIVEKFTLFIVIHWVTVLLADYVFVFLCRWR